MDDFGKVELLKDDLPLGLVEYVMKRLYTEDRLSGDEMRDLAHKLSAFLDQADFLFS